ncbi:putative oxygen-dependent FAD-linked oxidoreductase family protein [Lyophyllum shimeji]|uniref:Oxygen-dependent FAD-linked oxidoreductase family protein n=1 Tax=Lyophyllum shimeji TaxID=47721 RepID=A0A9P3PR74_LYOSH|nr:putative oxygen-dependent FAD-linked oxidoreductase family protein [Lyophyllum shimeji]
MQSPNFETYIFGNGTISACYLNTTLGVPCGQGSVPVIGVDARSVGDVQATVQFASKHNLRLVIKNTGHDYLGRSTARGALLLWTHHLKNITYQETFTPDGAPQGITYKVITLGAGVQWHEAYDAVEAEGRFILGGLSPGGSVGAAGGWVQGGGHSAFAARYALGVDNVLQFAVVTALGEYLTVNSYKNADLFWALRGGGGGTYAVIISTTYVTHDRFPLSVVGFQLHPSLSDAGWGGYSSVSAKDMSFFYIAPNISLANANATLDPFVKLAQNITGKAGAYSMHYDSFYPWYKATFGTDGQVGSNVELASRLLSRDMAENHADEVADMILTVGGVGINFVAGGAVSKVDPETSGLHPAWRKAVAHVYSVESWAEGTSVSDIQQARQRLRAALDILDGLGPGSATYYNEASLYEKDFKKSFFGPHYNRLKSIKAKYDPDTLFIVASGSAECNKRFPGSTVLDTNRKKAVRLGRPSLKGSSTLAQQNDARWWGISLVR